MSKWVYLLFFSLLLGCTLQPEDVAADWIVKANTAHGTSLLDATAFEFDFREYRYGYKKRLGKKVYRRIRKMTKGVVIDSLINDRLFSRWIDGEKALLADSLKQKYSESLNSVLYFMQIPKVLQDKAVMAKYMGKVRIKGEPYVVLKVSFQKEGGGVDFQDEYRYWIHEEQHLIDYLAYRFYTGNGGTRFRAVTKRERHDGFVVQDYQNFKPKEKFPALDQLPQWYEKGELQLVSTIENKAFRLDQ